MSLDKNLFKFFHLIFARESLLRTFQKIKCSNLTLHGLSLEFGAVKKKENNFSNFFKGSSIFEYSNKVHDKSFNIFINVSQIIRVQLILQYVVIIAVFSFMINNLTGLLIFLLIFSFNF